MLFAEGVAGAGVLGSAQTLCVPPIRQGDTELEFRVRTSRLAWWSTFRIRFCPRYFMRISQDGAGLVDCFKYSHVTRLKVTAASSLKVSFVDYVPCAAWWLQTISQDDPDTVQTFVQLLVAHASLQGTKVEVIFTDPLLKFETSDPELVMNTTSRRSRMTSADLLPGHLA